jgi:mannitol-specific phosphotransferase system IIBC component
MDFNSKNGDDPDLISNKVIKRMNKMFQTNDIDDKIIAQEDWTKNMSKFYKNNVKPNLFAIIILMIVAFMVLIKYLLKQDKDKQKEKEKLKEYVKKIKRRHNKRKRNNKITTDSEIDYGDEENSHDIYELTPIKSEFEDDDDNSNISHINEYYDRLQQEGGISDVMLRESREKDISRVSFDELARVIASGGN